MIAHYEITQGTEEWERLRYGKIGGTRAKGLFAKGDDLLLELLGEHTEQITIDYEGWQSAAMIRGTELEPIARKRVSEVVGVDFVECGWLQCEENPLLGISPDGISSDETIALEVKCTGNKNHVKAIRANEIPLEYLNQCLHYFTVNPKLEKLYFAMFRPENLKKQLFIKVVTRETEINLGTQAKPVFDTVQNWVNKSKELAKELQIQLDNELINFGF